MAWTTLPERHDAPCLRCGGTIRLEDGFRACVRCDRAEAECTCVLLAILATRPKSESGIPR